MYALTFILALIITVVCVSLILSANYHDGVIGRIGLACITLGCGVGIVVQDIIEFVDGTHDYHQVSPVGLLILCGLAVFMVRHYYRYWKFCKACPANVPQRRSLDSPPKFSQPSHSGR